ncbi:D-(-)-3-hydroxybutyrate oligomer hydrolase [Streptomyces azureus]|nr:D-(-)-3-hydroxybutyrate oligomer hydrolase [Streptomyces azureus]
MSAYSPVTGHGAPAARTSSRTRERQGLGALRAPPVTDGAFHVAAGCGEGAGVCDTGDRGDVVGVGAGRLQQRDEVRRAGGQAAFVFAPADEAIPSATSAAVCTLGRTTPASPGRARLRQPLRPTRLLLPAALDLTWAGLTEDRPLPPSQVVRTVPRGGEPGHAPALTRADVPPVPVSPAPGERIRVHSGAVQVPG